MRRTCLVVSVIVFSLTMLAACGGGYTIRGRVVEGGYAGISFVPAGDPMMQSMRGVSGAEVSVYRDPDRLNRSLAASTVSAPDGSFTLPVSAFGAGWMEETWQVRAIAAGRDRAEQFLSLPSKGSGLSLLIVLPEGRAAPWNDEGDLMHEYETYR